MRYARGMTHGAALGAALMFLLDPRQGGGRRAYVRDKSVRVTHELEEAAGVGARDLSHRIQGAFAKVFSRDEPATPEVLAERARARLGHVCRHASAVEVIPKGDGRIELKGAILAAEKPRVLAAMGRVRGVSGIDDALEAHATADVPALSSGDRRARISPARRMWSPAMGLLAGAGTAAMALFSLVRGHPLGFLVGGAGTLAIARSMARRNVHVRRGPHAASAEPVRGLREAYDETSEWMPVPT